MYELVDDLSFDLFFLCDFIEDFTSVSYKAPPFAKPSRQVPPYTGFGSEEDSLCSCQGLLPKPPQKDFRKLMEKDRYLVLRTLMYILQNFIIFIVLHL